MLVYSSFLFAQNEKKEKYKIAKDDRKKEFSLYMAPNNMVNVASRFKLWQPLAGLSVEGMSLALKRQSRKDSMKYKRYQGGVFFLPEVLYFSGNVSIGVEKRRKAKSQEKLTLVRGYQFEYSLLINDRNWDEIHQLNFSPTLGLMYELKHNFIINAEVRPFVGIYLSAGDYVVPNLQLFNFSRVGLGISYRFY